MPNFLRPSMVFLYFIKCTYACASKQPAPNTKLPSTITFLTALSPSRTASLIWLMVCRLGPRIRTVQLNAFLTSSINVNLSSPSVCSYTSPARPKQSGVKSFSELTAKPPHANGIRSILRFLARRMPTIPSFCNKSNEIGSMPCWFTNTNDLLGSSPHTFFLSANTACTLSLTCLRSDATNFSRCSADEYPNEELISVFSHSSPMLAVQMKQFSDRRAILGCLAP
mmetsp:Transcript_10751/g.16158  ORF Transcript_10751/g.16158 Transcript_10751/m.16158 type:complete len:225 (+) Transcript_10751:468-1142(+)